MSDQVFIFTMNQGGTIGKWSRYVFPFTIQWFAHLKDKLYLRAGDTVHRVEEHEKYDDGVPFTSVIQWPWLDFKKPGTDKMMHGFDIVGNGNVTVEIGYLQSDPEVFTDPFEVTADTLPGQMVPLPVRAPTFSVRLTFSSDQDWEWNAFQVYVEDMDLGK